MVPITPLRLVPIQRYRQYYIGGYQIAEKWLKDRKGTELDFNAIIHYSNILYVLTQTIYLSKEIDKIYI
ncbi:MAG: hypothetical protein ACLR16_06455, partial [Segatella copri]